MKKITLLMVVLISSLVGAQANAALMGPLPSSTYITNNGLDWTWAGGVSTGHAAIALAAPDTRPDWRYATLSELDYLDTILDLFFDKDGNAIESTAYWQGGPLYDIDDWTRGQITSGPGTIGPGQGHFETVYVRTAAVSAVPIPAAAFMFAPALLGLLGLRRRTKSNVA